jgi:TraM recognition site of TraD and TraG
MATLPLLSVSPELIPLAAVGALIVPLGLGAGGAWLMHRRTRLSPRNLYLTAGVLLVAVLAGTALFGAPALVLVPALGAAIAASAVGRRLRGSALGAGGELRQHERERLMLWQAAGQKARAARARERARGERTYVAGQGELVRERGWPAAEPAIPLAADGSGRLPAGEGKHLLVLGATGAGKTVTGRRWICARILAHDSAALVWDPKSDEQLAGDLRAAARRVGRPFVVFDPWDADADRWQPAWGDDPSAVVARVCAPIETTEPFYADALRVHLWRVAEALHAGGIWPCTIPLLLDAAQLHHWENTAQLADGVDDDALKRRLGEHGLWVDSREGRHALAGGVARLRVVMGEAWRPVFEPTKSGAITLPDALDAGAIVLWRTHVDDLPDEAQAITTLALGDAAAAAVEVDRRRTSAGREAAHWSGLIDEFGSVVAGSSGQKLLALMQRARSRHGQVMVLTQSAKDIEAVTANAALLESLTDNFAGFVIHRQTSAESRDWCAKLLGTRELWQSTDRTQAHGARGEGSGSRRRAAEFVVPADRFKELGVGEAYVWTTLGPNVELIRVGRAPRLDGHHADHANGLYRRLDHVTLPPPRKTDSRPQLVAQALDNRHELAGDSSPHDFGGPNGGKRV